MLGEVVDDLRIGHVRGQVQRIDVGVDVAVFHVGDVKVDVHGLDAALFKILIDVFDGFHPVDEANLELFRDAHVDDALHHQQNQHHEDAAYDGDQVVTIADGNAQAGGIPQRSGGSQTGDLAVGEQNRSGAQEADAADDLRAQTAEVVGDAGTGFDVDPCGEVGLDQRDDTGAQTDQNVRAHTRGAVFNLALDADDGADQNRE